MVAEFLGSARTFIEGGCLTPVAGVGQTCSHQACGAPVLKLEGQEKESVEESRQRHHGPKSCSLRSIFGICMV